MNYRELKTKYALTLDAQQEAAVQAPRGPVLLLAVPGSGKTTALVARLGYLIHCCGVAPQEILTMTYTVSATAELRRRFADRFGAADAERLEFRTINGVSARIIRCCEQLTGRSAFALEDNEARRSALLGELYRTATGEFATESVIRGLKTQITYVKNSMLPEEELETLVLEQSRTLFAPLYREYCRVLRAHRRMDYDDQMVYALRILQQCPEVLAAFRKGCRSLCVDEAQDTSRIQHEIIRLLAGRAPDLFMVGDEDQSIYGFRAAWPQALLEFENTYPGAKVFLMETNYRSGAQIVQKAAGVIAHNKQRRQKELIAARPAGLPVGEIWVKDRAEQAERLCRMAADCRVQTAVLYRDNDSALPVIDALERAGIPYCCRQAESGFFTSAAVRDILDILHFAAAPADGECFLRIYYKFNVNLTKQAAAAAAAVAARTGEPVLDLLLAEDPPAWLRTKLKALRTHLGNLAEDTAAHAVYRIVQYMGYGEYLDQRGADRTRVQILEVLAEREPTPARLAERLGELEAIVRRGAAAPCLFRLSTIHSSKGLEYDRVLLMDVADGLLPRLDEKAAPEARAAALEEERRLFYVGMTRAREELLIFRFRAAALPSAFAAEVFPPPVPKAEEKPARPRRPLSVLLAEAARAAAKGTPDAAAFTPGCRVRHRVFGAGAITAVRGDIAVVLLDDGAEKHIHLPTAVGAGLLEKE